MLAGLVQAPSRLAPTKNPDLAEKRMRLVLNAMVATGYLTEEERKALRTPRIDVRSRNTLPTGTYFADWALPEARKLSDVGYSRQTIATTLDARLQGIARRVTGRAGLGKAQVALVAMRPNGEVVAMIGGKDYAASPFNRATQARRQPGSTFKLFVYLAALREGWDPDDVIDNSAIETGSYRPKKFRRRLFEIDHARRRVRFVEQCRRGAAAAPGRRRKRSSIWRATWASPRRWKRATPAWRSARRA